MLNISARPYQDPLQITAPSPFNWWDVSPQMRAVWGEPFTLTVRLSTPEARLHFDHTLVSTLTGSIWCRNLTSEGFKIDLGCASITFDASKEFSLPDPAAPVKFLPPSYGRRVSLTSSFQGNQVTKSVVINSKNSQGNTAADHFVSFAFDGVDKLFVYLNGSLLMVTSVSVDPTALVMSQFRLTPTPITDSKGEMVLNLPWDLTLPVEPDYTIVPHPTTLRYPEQYVGYSPEVYSIELTRGSISLSQDPLDTSVSDRLGSAFVNITNEQNEPFGILSLGRNHTGYLNLQVTDAKGNNLSVNRNFLIKWNGQTLASGLFSNGKFLTTVMSATPGSGVITITDFADFDYTPLNPVYLIIS